MQVAVVGAGIGGLAVARALIADGHQVACYERAEALRTSGAALTLWSNGTAVLDALGVPYADLGAPIDILATVRGTDGRTLMDIDVAHAADRYGFPHRSSPRREIIRRLAHGLPPGTVHFDKRAVGVSQTPEQAEVGFDDGTSVTAELVIAADGACSVLRETVFGDPTRPAAFATWQGLTRVDIETARSTRGLMIVGREGMCGLLPAGDGLVMWWFDRPWNQDDPQPASALAMLKERFGDWAAPVAETLAAADDSQIEFFAHRRQKVGRGWSRGRVVLLGDAAHTMPPTVAQGANQALEDAWALARGLRVKPGDLAAGLAEYERTRLKGARLTQRIAGSELTDKYQPAVMPLIPDILVTRFHTRWLKMVSTILTVGA
ncbi:FAD-dependent monooxygenase [Catenulispora sp. NF23]|uniref:FAD-dependent monooxygenase n=1 Tax=Catenulispora pinistramenti TaxID=2705254 RepID=A0ABS5KS87_9ACTN|nr:NAD(P)/FAD-dependent oxidoreductase [Catenulispora pinistramenti]MBS2533374.1 FAD-dependent monooxygenase [Catenulispora pinistramenti]MBS2548899.1 FAD-dependent monooxygenase [Catenulispora pinistramenti]